MSFLRNHGQFVRPLHQRLELDSLIGFAGLCAATNVGVSDGLNGAYMIACYMTFLAIPGALCSLWALSHPRGLATYGAAIGMVASMFAPTLFIPILNAIRISP